MNTLPFITKVNLYRTGAIWAYRADTAEGFDHADVLDADDEQGATEEIKGLFPDAVISRVADL